MHGQSGNTEKWKHMWFEMHPQAGMVAIYLGAECNTYIGVFAEVFLSLLSWNFCWQIPQLEWNNALVPELLISHCYWDGLSWSSTTTKTHFQEFSSF